MQAIAPTPQPKLLDSQQGFELRLISDDSTNAAEATYTLDVTPADGGKLAVAIMVDAHGLRATAVELRFSGQTYAVTEGEYGEWPETSAQALSHKLELEKPGLLRYIARPKQDAEAGVSGKFELLRVILSPVQAKPA